MPAHDWQVAKHGGRSVESGYVHESKTIADCFDSMARKANSREADFPLDQAREARKARLAAEAAAAAAADLQPRAPQILERKLAREMAGATPGTMAHALGRAFTKAKQRARK